MPDYNSIVTELKKELLIVTQESYGLIKKDAEKNVNEFFNECESDLIRWTDLLSEDEITLNEFKNLVNAQKDLLKVEILKQKAVTQIEIDTFKDKVVQIIIGVIIKFI